MSATPSVSFPFCCSLAFRGLEIDNLALPGRLASPRVEESLVEVSDVLGFTQDREFHRRLPGGFAVTRGEHDQKVGMLFANGAG